MNSQVKSITTQNFNEAYLISLWKEKLNLGQIQVDKNLFLLGAHSLQVMEVKARLQKDFGCNIAVEALFKRPTIAEQVAYIKQVLVTSKRPEPEPNAVDGSGIDRGVASATATRLADNSALIETSRHFPLSPQQERLYSLYRANPNDVAYHLHQVFLVEATSYDMKLSELVARARTSLLQLIHSHPSLRTTFNHFNGEVWQCIETPADAFLTVIEHKQELNDGEEEVVISRLSSEQYMQPFELAEEFPIRVVLEHYQNAILASVTIHHIACDGISLELLVADWLKLWLESSSLVGGIDELNRPVDSFAYIDYVIEQKNLANSQDDLNYWLTYLDKAPLSQQIDVWSDAQPVDAVDYTGKRLTLPLTNIDTKMLTRSIAPLGVSNFSFLFTVFQILMSRYLKMDDVVIGVPVDTRGDLYRGVVGHFANSLLLRNRDVSHQTLLELMQQNQKELFASLEHKAVDQLELLTRLARSGVAIPQTGCHYSFAMQHTENVQWLQMGGSVELEAGLSVRSGVNPDIAIKNELSLAVNLSQEGIYLVFEYDHQRYSQQHIKTIGKHFGQLIDSMLRANSGLETAAAVSDEVWSQPVSVFRHETLEELPSALAVESGSLADAAPLSQLQKEFYLDSLVRGEKANSQGCIAWFKEPLDVDLLQTVVNYLAAVQPILRSRVLTSTNPFYEMAYQVADSHGVPTVEIIPCMDLLDDQKRLNSDADSQLNATVMELAQSLAYSSFPQLDEPLFRFFALDCGKLGFVFIASCHHIVMDGMSLAQLGNMGCLLYENYLNTGKKEDLQAMIVAQLHASKSQQGIQAGNDFLTAFKKVQNITDLANDQDHWRAYLNTASSVDKIVRIGKGFETLPADEVAEENLANDGFIRQTLRLQPELWQRVTAASRKNKVTPMLFLQSVYGLLVGYLYASDQDFIIKNVVSGRKQGLDMDLGCFIQQQPILIRKEHLRPDAGFNNILQSLKLSQKTNKRKSFLSTKALNGMVDSDGSQFTFNFYHFTNTVTLGEHEVVYQVEPALVPNYVQFIAQVDGATVQLKLLAPSEIELDRRFLERFVAVVEQLCGEASSQHTQDPVGWQQLTDLEFLLPDEIDTWHTLARADEDSGLAPSNLTQADDEGFTPVLSQIEASVRRCPASIAIESEGFSISYSQLWTKAASIAEELKKHEVEAGHSVALFFDKEPAYFASILAVQMVGAIFVPLDINNPSQRNHSIIQDAQCVCILAGGGADEDISELLEVAGQIKPRLYLPVDNEFADSAADDGSPDPEQVSVVSSRSLKPSDVAYIIYTSGSTGKPKGVAVSHGALSLTQKAWAEAYDLKIDDHRFHLQMAGTGFDVCVGDWVRALTQGAGLLLVKREQLLQPSKIHDLLLQGQLQFAEFVPAVMRELFEVFESSGKRIPHTLKLVVGSDSWFQEDQLRLINICEPQTEIYNSYGVTEATIDSTLYKESVPSEADPLDSKREAVNATKAVPIGKPLPNTQIYLVNKHRQILPPSQRGEICIVGRLAEGYWGDKTATAEVFVDFSGLQGESKKAYLTKDLGSMDSEGNLIHLGRCNEQLKIRGFRVELGEIETAILAASMDLNSAKDQSIKQVAVVAIAEAERGQFTQLVAYLALREAESEVDVTQLQEHLANYLPSYMQPHSIFVLPEIPLNTNGKVDKKTLKELAKESLAETKRLASTSTEEALAGIWQEVLGLTQVDVTRSFFELGGHSLLANKILSRIKQNFRLELPLKSLFEADTVESLAAVIDSYSTGQDQSDISAGETGELNANRLAPTLTQLQAFKQWDEFPLSFSQERLWFLYQLDPNSTAYNMPATIQIRGRLDLGRLERAIQTVVSSHDALRIRIKEKGGVVVQQLMQDPSFSLRVRDLTHLEGGYQDYLKTELLREQMQPFTVEGGELFRIRLFKLQESSEDKENIYVLFASLHHIIFDGASLPVLIGDIAKHYWMQQGGDQSSIMEPSFDAVRFVDYCAWQREYFNQQRHQQCLNFWQKELSGAPLLLNLPTDRERPSIQSYNGAIESYQFSSRLRQKILSHCEHWRMTPYMFLLGAYGLTLSRLSQQEDICIGTTVSGRNHESLESLVGLFVNGLVMRVKASGSNLVGDYLQLLKNTVLHAFEHQDIAAESVIESLDIPRSLSYAPIAQVGFSMNSDALPTTAGLQVTGVGSSSRLEFDGLELSMLPSQHLSSRLDLTLFVNDRGSQYGIDIEYSTDLFNKSTIDRIFDAFTLSIDFLLGDDQGELNEFALITKKQTQALIEEQVNVTENFRALTSMQKDLYFDTLKYPEATHNSLGFSLELGSRKDINIDLWCRCIDRCFLELPALTARVVPVSDKFHHDLYLVDSVGELVGHEVEVCSLENNAQIAALVADYIYQPFKVELSDNQNLFRAKTLQLKDGRYLFVFSCHHLLLDGAACGELVQWLLQHYRSMLAAEGKPSAELENESLPWQGEARKQQSADAVHWQTVLNKAEGINSSWIINRDVLQTTDLNSLEPAGHSLIQRRNIAPELSRSIKRKARKLGVTPALFFKALYGYLLSKLTASESTLAVKEYVSGRGRDERGVLGCFYQIKPFTVSLFNSTQQGEKIEVAFDTLLDECKKQYKHSRNTSGLSVAELLDLQSDQLIPFSFNYINFVPGLSLSNEDAAETDFLNIHRFTPHRAGEIDFVVEEKEDRFHLSLTYDVPWISDARFVQRMEALAKQWVQDEERFDLLLTEDRCQLLADRGKSEPSIALEVSVVAQFEHRAMLTPNEIAIRQGTDSITFAELNARADQLAIRIREELLALRNQATEEFQMEGGTIAVALDKSIDAIVSILAVLKSNNGYLPLDLSLPPARHKYIIEDVGANLVITGLDVADRFFESDVSLLSPHGVEIHKGQPNVMRAREVRACFYTIYTSGSTGTPKGISIREEAVINLINWYVHTMGIRKSHSCYLISSLGFDLTQKNIFSFLIYGAGLCLPAHQQFEPELMVSELHESKASHLNCAPSAFYPLLAESGDNFERLCGLKYLIFGGESIDLSALTAWMGSGGFSTKIVNSYGPTECTDVVSSHELKIGQHELNRYLNIGIPVGEAIDHVCLTVTDEEGNALPAGFPGLLQISGIGVADGYIGAAKTQNKAFTITADGGEKRYCTGDYAVRDRQGRFYFLGRRDDQVKLRGLRIDLQEIERLIEKNERINRSLVRVEKDLLVAYLEANNDGLNTGDIEQELKPYLPSYMIPAQFRCVEQWPLTPNGKIDTKRLQSNSAVLQGRVVVAPRSPDEKELAGLWQQVLTLVELSVDDNFFHVGGHSLLATKLATRIRDKYGIDFPVRLIFEYPMLAAMAQQVKVSRAALAINKRTKIAPLEVEPVVELARGEIPVLFPLSFNQERIWLLEQLAPKSGQFNMPVTFSFTGQLDMEAVKSSFKLLVYRHESLRTRFLAKAGEAGQFVTTGEKWAVDEVDLSTEESFNQAWKIATGIVAKHENYPFDLLDDDLFKVKLITLPAKEDLPKYIISFNLHHIIADGWSMEVLLTEFTALYLQQVKSIPISLPKVEAHYKDFAVWQRQRLDEETLASLSDHWRSYLQGAPREIEFPDFSRLSTSYKSTSYKSPKNTGADQSQKQDHQRQALNIELPISSQEIDAFAQQRGISPFALFLSAYALVVAKLTEQSDLTIGLPLAGRTEQEIEHTVGMFVNGIVVRVQLEKVATVGAFLDLVKEQVLQSFDHQDIPADRLAQALDLDRSAQNMPGSQLGMNYQTYGNTKKQEMMDWLDQLGVGLFNENLNEARKPVDQWLNESLKQLRDGQFLFDLQLSVTQLEDRFLLSLGYKSDKFSTEAVALIAEAYQTVFPKLLSDQSELLVNVECLSRERFFAVNQLEDSVIESLTPLSAQQQAIMLDISLRGEQADYNQGFAVELLEPLDIEKLELCIRIQGQAQPALRSALVRTENYFADSNYIATYIDTYWAEHVQLLEPMYGDLFDANRFNNDEIAQHFMLKKNAGHGLSMVRHGYVKTAEDRFLLLFSAHHLVLDGVSVALHLQQLKLLYQNMSMAQLLALLESNSQLALDLDPLSEEPVCYLDRDLWVQEQASKEYWRSELAACQPLDSYRIPLVGDDQLCHLTDQLTGDLQASLSVYCRKHGITKNLFFRGVLGYMLQRYFQPNSDFHFWELDLPLAKVRSGRLGCHVRQLPVKMNTKLLSENTALLEFWQQLKADQKHSKHFRGIDRSQLQESTSGTGASVLLNYIPFTNIDLSGERVGYVREFSNELNDIHLRIKEESNGLKLELIYWQSQFDDTLFLHRLKQLVEQLIVEDSTSLGELVFVLESEQSRLLSTLGGESLPLGQQPSFQQMLGDSFSQHQELIALVAEDRQWTYRELNDWINALCDRLVGLGVARGHAVAVHLPRGPEVIAAVLAIHRLGAYYVPLALDNPPVRNEKILEDCVPSLILSQQAQLDRLPGSVQAPILNLNADEPAIELLFHSFTTDESLTANGVVDISEAVADNELAYILYTSGSTGVPKGVRVSRRNLLNFLLAFQQELELGCDQRILSLTSLAFDIAGLEIWLPLLQGAAIVVANDEVIRDGEALRDLIVSQRVDLIQATPSSWQLLMLTDWSPVEDNAAIVGLCGGEALSPNLAQEIAGRGISLINVYGPTETTIWSTLMRLSPAKALSSKKSVYDGFQDFASVPIGKAILNTQLYILDDSRRPVPQGTVGELYIGGEGVASGYLNRPELNQKTFLSKDDFPFTEFGLSSTNQTIYKTGDRVRLNARGDLEYLGRVDHQVKLRGHRFELGEVEAALKTLSGVSESAVVLESVDGSSDNKRLLAFVTSREALQGVRIQSFLSDLKAEMIAKVSHYMVPTDIYYVSSMPLTVSGKIDRKKLLAQKLEYTTGNLDRSPVRSKTEVLLASLWQQLLRVDEVYREDNFFELGGHSLLAVKLVARIKERFAIDIPLTQVFSHPSLSALAEYIDGFDQSVRVSSVVKLSEVQKQSQTAEQQPTVVLIHPIGGTVSVYRELVQLLSPYYECVGIQAYGLEQGQTPFADMSLMVEQYRLDLLEAGIDGPVILLGHSLGGLIALEMAKQMRAEQQDVVYLGLIDSFLPDQQAYQFRDKGEIIDHLFNTSGLDQLLDLSKNELALSEVDLVELTYNKLDSLGLIDTSITLPLVKRRFQTYLSLLEMVTQFTMPSEDFFIAMQDRIKHFSASEGVIIPPAPSSKTAIETREVELSVAEFGENANDSDTSLAEPSESLGQWRSSDYGWYQFLGERFRSQQIEANHDSILTGEAVESLADLIVAETLVVTFH